MIDIKCKEIQRRIKLLEAECLRLAMAGSFYDAPELIAHTAVQAYEQDMIDRMMSTFTMDQTKENNVIEFKPKE